MDKSIDNLDGQLKELSKSFKRDISAIKDLEGLNKLKDQYIGKKSQLNSILEKIVKLPKEDKQKVGKDSNLLKLDIIKVINEKTAEIQTHLLKEQEDTEKTDVTLPGKTSPIGHRHIITQTIWECEDIFAKMGFEVDYPFEIDDDYHNFESVNIPKDHPARDNQDTFWTKDGHVAITHTSSMQNRVMSSRKPPIRVVVPGRCFRNEATDPRHEHTFYQIEGVYVDKQVTLTDMLGTLKEFFSKYFGKDLDIKFMPDFFPFVEPGGQIALSCYICDGKGCDVCKKSGWLEILGCGMIHPNVLTMAGIDPATYSGFAWGFGVARLAMLKYGIEDTRHFNSGNLDFIKQF